jgi:nicotinic acid mononucleotide adenylyltransferase
MQKVVSPFSGKLVPAHQLLADTVIYFRESTSGPLDPTKKRGQYVAAAKILREIPDQFEDIIFIIGRDKIKDLFKLTWGRCAPLKKKLDMLEAQRTNKPRPNKSVFLGGEIEKL